MQVVVFRLGEEQFAVDTSRVQSINDNMSITIVPKSEKHIKGLINLRGNIISLLDINLVLGIPANENSQKSIIILETSEELIGVAVDQVDEVLELSDSVLENVEDEKKKPCIKGILNLKQRIVTLIDIDKLV